MTIIDEVLEAGCNRDRRALSLLEQRAFKERMPVEVKSFIRDVDNCCWFLIRGDVYAAEMLEAKITQTVNVARCALSNPTQPAPVKKQTHNLIKVRIAVEEWPDFLSHKSSVLEGVSPYTNQFVKAPKAILI